MSWNEIFRIHLMNDDITNFSLIKRTFVWRFNKKYVKFWIKYDSSEKVKISFYIRWNSDWKKDSRSENWKNVRSLKLWHCFMFTKNAFHKRPYSPCRFRRLFCSCGIFPVCTPVGSPIWPAGPLYQRFK